VALLRELGICEIFSLISGKKSSKCRAAIKKSWRSGVLGVEEENLVQTISAYGVG